MCVDAKEIQSKITEIREIVKDFEEPYKTESFKILFTKELSNSKIVKNLPDDPPNHIEPSELDDVTPLERLAKSCDMQIEQIMDVFDYENKQFVLLKKISGNSTAEKQVNASLCILTAWAKGMNTPWLKVTDLGKAIKEIPLPTKHLGENITKTEYFVPKGNAKGAKYHITTSGWKAGITLIRELAGMDKIDK